MSSRGFSTSEKAAALLLAMEKPLASKLLKHFDEVEVKLVAQTAARLGNIPKTEIDQLVDEFATALRAGSDLQGTVQETERLLSSILPPDKVLDIMTDIRGDASGRVWGSLGKVSETVFAQYVQKQHPQVTSFILSKLPGATVAAILEQCPNTLRVEVMRRMISLKAISEVPLKALQNNLMLELVSKVNRNSVPDVHARIAAVLNKMGKEYAEEVFTGLNESRPKDAEKIKGLLFTFDDIAKISDAARTKLFEEVTLDQTIMSLKGAQPQLQALILGCLGQRSRRMIEQELENGRPVSRAEISKAQRAVADRALELADRGIIDIGGE